MHPFYCSALVVGLLLISGISTSAATTNLNSIPADLVVPAITHGEPTAGRRVETVTMGWEETQVRHALYLPRDWQPGKKYPVLVEYAGNGGYTNTLGDTSNGTVEGSVLGYGLSGGEGYIWLCLPFVEVRSDGTRQNATSWWGDVSETKRYCIATVRDVCARYGGDTNRVVLCGFSRGAIACNYIGLHDEEVAGLWRAFFCHSHYDGVRKWPYPASDANNAPQRLRRLNGRPQWISHEQSTAEASHWIEQNSVRGSFTFVQIPYPNHSAAWVLRDIPQRKQAREWLASATAEQPTR